MDFAKLDQIIDSRLPEMEQDLAALVACPSVGGESAGPNAPFGPEVRRALDAMLGITGRFGLPSRDMEGYCGYADLPGTREDTVGVLGHLDVVPARAADWKHPPFAMTAEDGRLYGRGVIDDKGPTLAALYGAMALRELGAPLRKTVRFIFGCNEETGMACMKHYLETEPAPSCGFTPDAQWPLIVGEKGILHYSLDAQWEPAKGGARLASLRAGAAANVVPAQAQALLLDADGLPEAEGISLSREGNAVAVTALGVAAHASTPEEGDNALTKLLCYLSRVPFGPAGAKDYVDALAKLLRDDKYGGGLGIAGEDELSRTTNAPTVCTIGETGGSLTCDLRFRLTDKTARYREILAGTAGEHGLRFVPGLSQEPLYLGGDHPLAAGLLRSYREVTGDMSQPLVIGGGTYAKVMPNFLAFGPEPCGAPTRAHQADEFLTEKELLDSAKIYARAIWYMAR